MLRLLLADPGIGRYHEWSSLNAFRENEKAAPECFVEEPILAFNSARNRRNLYSFALITELAITTSPTPAPPRPPPPRERARVALSPCQLERLCCRSIIITSIGRARKGRLHRCNSLHPKDRPSRLTPHNGSINSYRLHLYRVSGISHFIPSHPSRERSIGTSFAKCNRVKPTFDEISFDPLFTLPRYSQNLVHPLYFLCVHDINLKKVKLYPIQHRHCSNIIVI